MQHERHLPGQLPECGGASGRPVQAVRLLHLLFVSDPSLQAGLRPSVEGFPADAVASSDAHGCRAAEADEPADMNFIRAHSSAMTSDGLDNSSARMFSNPAGAHDEHALRFSVCSCRAFRSKPPLRVATHQLLGAGDYGSMVNERVGAGEWEDGKELGDTWASRNSFSYGRCAAGAAPAPARRRHLASLPG